MGGKMSSMRVVCLGLDGAGKTTLIRKAQGISEIPEPTVGFNPEIVTLDKMEFNVADVRYVAVDSCLKGGIAELNSFARCFYFFEKRKKKKKKARKRREKKRKEPLGSIHQGEHLCGNQPRGSM
jgi:ABC-type phosphate/phosphonate transport system ATPase subunit